jgi:hypothetical protein
VEGDDARHLALVPLGRDHQAARKRAVDQLDRRVDQPAALHQLARHHAVRGTVQRAAPAPDGADQPGHRLALGLGPGGAHG